jgi:hypothetical protein
MRAHRKRYLIDVLSTLPVLALWLSATRWLPADAVTRVGSRAVIALLPLFAMAWTIVALLRLLRMDEFGQRIELVAIASAVSGVGRQSALGLPEMDGLVPPISLFHGLPALIGGYGLVKWVIWARCR